MFGYLIGASVLSLLGHKYYLGMERGLVENLCLWGYSLVPYLVASVAGMVQSLVWPA